MKTILITGGAGFIGSHLCKKYLDLGHRVICVDNLQTTRKPKNIEQFLSNPRFRFIKQDIIEPLWIGEKIDWIFNFACSGSYTSYQYNPVHTMKTNTIGMMHMLELAKKNDARIMQASTSEIYGDPLETPQKETYTGNVNMLGPRACYDEGKRAAETLCMDYVRAHNVDVKIIRIFNTYGPNMDLNDGRAITNFIVNALDSKDVVVYGDGSHTRSFQYIDDLVRGIDLMMEKDDFVGPVNLGNPNTELNMKELAELIIKKTKSSSQLVFKEKATDDPRTRCPDTTLAKTKLNWESLVPIEEGLSQTIEYFKNISRPDKKVLVFATTYYPTMGPAESALRALSGKLPDTEFHIVTTRFKRNVLGYDNDGTDHIYRVGFGTSFDKYLLPILGPWRAYKLHKKNQYRFAWSIMASYGGVSAFLFKLLARDMHFLITLDDRELTEEKSQKRWYSLLYQLIFKSSDTIYVTNVLQEHKARELYPDLRIKMKHGSLGEFINQVRSTYTELINRQEGKLARPR